MSGLRLDLGAGEVSPPGFIPMGHAHGSQIFPLPHADGTVDEIYASHVLEHFAHAQIGEVVADWVRALKPGGRLRIAVPDFEKIAQGYLDGQRMPTESFLMGGQVDASDFHRSLFDETRLKQAMAGAGLVLLRRWTSELDDCAALPISLNLEGTKPFASEIKVSACMSVPRLGFMDNFFCAFEALPSLGITLRKQTGAFWGQSLTQAMEDILESERPDAILTLDYDTVFKRVHVATLIQLMLAHPEADAIAPVQASRHNAQPLFTMRGADGSNAAQVPFDTFASDLTPISTAHFGLTLIRADKLRALPKPWFRGEPDASGGWGKGHVDEDIMFWRKWEEAGDTLFLANRVSVGHMELMVRWAGKDLSAIYQPTTEFTKHGVPEEAWS